MSPTTSALVLAWTCIVVLALATAGLLRRVEALERQVRAGGGAAASPAGPPTGLQLPLARHLGAAVSGERDVLLLVVAASCGSCAAALRQLAAADTRHLDVVVVTADDTVEPLPVPAGVPVVPRAGELVDVLGVPATPFAVRLDRSGTIRRADVLTSGTDLGSWTTPRSLDVTVDERSRR